METTLLSTVLAGVSAVTCLPASTPAAFVPYAAMQVGLGWLGLTGVLGQVASGVGVLCVGAAAVSAGAAAIGGPLALVAAVLAGTALVVVVAGAVIDGACGC